MTWVAAGSCFNGFACIADVQATIIHNSQSIKYINCVQKLHKIYDNVVIGFSGNIEIGLKLIQILKEFLEDQLREPYRIFDLDGEVDHFQHNLKVWFSKLVKAKIPNQQIELLICWFAQDEGEYFFKPYCWSFSSPDFKRKGTCNLDAFAFGSGANTQQLGTVLKFLRGYSSELFPEHISQYDLLNKAFGGENPLWTVKKFKNFLIEESQKFELPGISRSLHFCEGTLPFDSTFPKDFYPKMKVLFQKLGVEYSNLERKDGEMQLVVADFDRIIEHIKQLPLKEQHEIGTELKGFKDSFNPLPLTEVPSLEINFHINKDENINPNNIFSTWKELKDFLKSEHEIVLANCIAYG